MPASEAMNEQTPTAPAESDPEKAAEYREVRQWLDAYVEARKFDEDIHKQYAKDRAHARGDSGFAVDVNLIGTFIDISESFLYAKAPDLDVTPSKACAMPDASLIEEAAAEVAKVQGERAGMQAAQGGVTMALQAGVPPEQAAQIAAQGAQFAEQGAGAEALVTAVDSIKKYYQDRQRDAKALAETLELVISHKWKKAKLKKRGRRLVRSGLTVGPGVLKATFQTRTEQSPQTKTQMRDLQTNLLRVQSLLADMEENSADRDKVEQQARELAEQMATLKAQPEQTIARDYVLEVVQPENHTVAPGYSLGDAEDAPWQAERIPTRLKLAKDLFPDVPSDKWGKAALYHARKPEPLKNISPAMADGRQAKDADSFVPGHEQGQGEPFVMVIEIWDAEANLVRTAIEGIPCWAKKAWTPPATGRFYPYFIYLVGETGEERHPISLVTRSAKLVDEYNRMTSDERKHRRRCLPKMAFNAGGIAKKEMDKLTDAEIGEMVGLKFSDPSLDISKILKEVAYPAFDGALYDRSRLRNELETIWGIQEALSGGVEAAKTATEADIQQQGFQSRTTGRRESLDSLLNELAQYSAELLRANLTIEEVQAIAGPHAFWPAYEGPDKDALRLVTVEIVAGSSGKPNSAADKQNWSVLLPILQNGITTIAQLRGSLPTDVADAQERLLRLTAERLGERLDVDALLPKAGPALAPVAPGAPNPNGGTAPLDPNAPPAGPTAAAPMADAA